MVALSSIFNNLKQNFFSTISYLTYTSIWRIPIQIKNMSEFMGTNLNQVFEFMIEDPVSPKSLNQYMVINSIWLHNTNKSRLLA